MAKLPDVQTVIVWTQFIECFNVIKSWITLEAARMCFKILSFWIISKDADQKADWIFWLQTLAFILKPSNRIDNRKEEEKSLLSKME